jgi:hypothetical protein
VENAVVKRKRKSASTSLEKRTSRFRPTHPNPTFILSKRKCPCRLSVCPTENTRFYASAKVVAIIFFKDHEESCFANFPCITSQNNFTGSFRCIVQKSISTLKPNGASNRRNSAPVEKRSRSRGGTGQQLLVAVAANEKAQQISEPGSEEKMRKHAKDTEKYISQHSNELGLKMVKYIYGDPEKSVARRSKRQNQSDWEI